MEHILTDCDFSGKDSVFTEQSWSHTGKPWTKPSLGLIVGCSLHMYTNEEGRVDSGLSCLYTIIMSEGAHFIWNTQNEWRIGTQGNLAKLPQPGELCNKWLTVMSKYLGVNLDSRYNRTR
ncbi:hypothetical protein M422DRAFT_190185 [Sphaerobolus stellatus SS14]|uniref:Uncharacterized protein n=1 Tax=Sphaerobolus stellatus (strain SS14) TaxID=990650 RepID=A0A0C9US88_SPHS4|nr:hypothetical protein M422DRAFT_190185 [Sphaerobolus stellatus SS14]